MPGLGEPTAEPAADARRAALLEAALPVVFVLIWSTGFIVAKLGMPHAPPLTFLSWRFALSVLAFGLWVLLARAAWPKGATQWGHLAVTGVLMHAGYLGGLWAAVKDGMGAGTAALIVGVQPVLTALWLSARGRERRIGRAQWLGLVLGLAGLVLVVWEKLGIGEVRAANLTLAVMALACITAATLYQKRWVIPGDVRSGNLVQLMAALAVCAPLSLLEHGSMQWHPELLAALGWSVLVLTLGGSSLLLLLLQRGSATGVSSLMYLVPPCTALIAWWLFGETLTVLVWAGMALAAAGVWLVVRQPRR